MSDHRERQRELIVRVASRLAEARGFDGVGLRDVAEEAGLAMGTLYKSFRNKDEMLGAVVAHGIAAMRGALGEAPLRGAPADRVVAFFEKLTHVVARHPPIARALLGALSSSNPALVSPILRSDVETTRMIVAAIRGVGAGEVDVDGCTEDELELALLLRHLWFASMVGWANELHSLEEVVRHVELGARRLL